MALSLKTSNGAPCATALRAVPVGEERSWSCTAHRAVAHSRWLGIGGALILAASVVGCAPRDEPRGITFTQQDWRFADRAGTMLETEHYRIYTTVADERLLKQFPLLLERAFDQYQLLAPPAYEPTGKTESYLMADRAEWQAFTKRHFPPERAEQLLKIRWGGYSEEGIAVIEYVSNSATYPVLVHEGLHQYLHNYVNQRVPAWLNEGLAVCAEGMRWYGDAEVHFDMWDNPGRRNRLAELVLRDELIPLKTLLRTHAGRVIDGAPTQVQAYYAQVWALCLFLMDEEGPYAAKFAELRASLGARNLERRARANFISQAAGQYNYGESLFRAMINDDLEAVEKQYHEFMREKFLTAPGGQSNWLSRLTGSGD